MKPRSPVPRALQLTPWHCVCLLSAHPTLGVIRGTSKTFLAYANMTNSLPGPGPASGAVWTQVYLQRGSKGMVWYPFQDKAAPLVPQPQETEWQTRSFSSLHMAQRDFCFVLSVLCSLMRPKYMFQRGESGDIGLSLPGSPIISLNGWTWTKSQEQSARLLSPVWPGWRLIILWTQFWKGVSEVSLVLTNGGWTLQAGRGKGHWE